MIASGCVRSHLLLLRTQCPPSCQRGASVMAAFRSPSRPTPGVRVTAPERGSDSCLLASPSAENLLLFCESPTVGWLSTRGLSGSAVTGADEPPSIVLTPAEPPAPAAAESQETGGEKEQQAQPPPVLSPMLGYLRETLKELVAARNENKAPHTLEVS